MRALLIALTLTLPLAACGADGAPTPPTKSAITPGLSLSGEARTGVVTTL
jgi:predicted small lipoprotein YifL